MTGKKRKYIAPLIETHAVDQEICLVMFSEGFGGGGGNPFLKSSEESASTIDFAPTLNDSQPFGNDTPDFSNMD